MKTIFELNSINEILHYFKDETWRNAEIKLVSVTIMEGTWAAHVCVLIVFR
jgi:hypothetical protein